MQVYNLSNRVSGTDIAVHIRNDRYALAGPPIVAPANRHARGHDSLPLQAAYWFIGYLDSHVDIPDDLGHRNRELGLIRVSRHFVKMPVQDMRQRYCGQEIG